MIMVTTLPGIDELLFYATNLLNIDINNRQPLQITVPVICIDIQ